MIVVLCALIAAVLVGLVVLLLIGWGGLLTRLQRLGLSTMASGLVLAAVPRLAGNGPGLGDLLFLGGIVLFLGATYLPAIWRHVDGLDGAVDGRIGRPRA